MDLKDLHYLEALCPLYLLWLLEYLASLEGHLDLKDLHYLEALRLLRLLWLLERLENLEGHSGLKDLHYLEGQCRLEFLQFFYVLHHFRRPPNNLLK